MISFISLCAWRCSDYCPPHSTDEETEAPKQGSPARVEPGFEPRESDSRALVLNHGPVSVSQNQHLTQIYYKKPNLHCARFLPLYLPQLLSGLLHPLLLPSPESVLHTAARVTF